MVVFVDFDLVVDVVKVVLINLEGLFLGDLVFEDYLEGLNVDVIVL